MGIEQAASCLHSEEDPDQKENTPDQYKVIHGLMQPVVSWEDPLQ